MVIYLDVIWLLNFCFDLLLLLLTAFILKRQVKKGDICLELSLDRALFSCSLRHLQWLCRTL